MAVAWNNTTLNDKVKLPSVTELGFIAPSSQFTYGVIIEGNEYPLMRHFKNLATWRLRSYSTKNSNVAITVAKAGEIDDLIVEFS